MRRTYFKNTLPQKVIISIALLAVTALSCNKLVNNPLPVNSITGPAAYNSDNAVSSVVTGNFIGIYIGTSFSSGTSIGYLSGLYTDEIQNIDPSNTTNQAFYTDQIVNTQTPQWSDLYKDLYDINSAITGITGTKVVLTNRDQWLGESLFTRAFTYFSLVNVFGDVPMPITPDYKTNNQLARVPKAQVYQQMISDLDQSVLLLSNDYKDGYSTTTNDRSRPNKLAATALRARIYLYTNDWKDAEADATTIIGNNNFQMVSPDQTFLTSSREIIWDIAPTVSSSSAGFVKDYESYNGGMPAIIPASNSPLTYGVSAQLSPSLVNSFESGDARYLNWVRSSVTTATATQPAITYFFPNKYKSRVNGVEYMVMLRLAEQYLIRAEARAQQGNLQGALSDLNVIRSRAGLASAALSNQANLLKSIAVERQKEFFTELGHRFFDLKRTGEIDAVMNMFATQKGGTWSSYKQIWPIPPGDILQDPNLTQAPGY